MKSKLIKITEDGVEYENEIFAYKEFKNIPKGKLLKLLHYMYLRYSDYELSKMSENERQEEALYHSGMKEEELKEWTKQIDLYKKLIRTPVLSALESTKEMFYLIVDMNNKVIKELQKHLEADSINIDTIKGLQAMIKESTDNINKVPSIIKTLAEVEDRYNADIAESGQLRGSQQKGYFSRKKDK